MDTDLVFDKFADCLAAEEQMRKHYTDAFEAWDRWAPANIERRREYSKARDLQAKRLLSNIGTCVPHAGGDAVAPQQQNNPTPSQPSQATPLRSQVRKRNVRTFRTGPAANEGRSGAFIAPAFIALATR
ncbi:MULTISPECIES: hypothetical protein [Bradyrhizobium]|uniref:hypothetical protein n=1 Tax=Bradyrhizobium TaxID=374 RepID=UPI001FEC7F0F|nr:hypothetical protein [Bradyrhizobium canariense]